MAIHAAQDIAALTAYLVRRNRSHPRCLGVNPIPAQPDNSLETLRPRYPFLCNHRRGSETQSNASQTIQQRTHAKFEIRLSHYRIEQIRRSQLSDRPDLPSVKTPIPNPTLLSDFGVRTAFERFTGAVWGADTHKDLAHRFLFQTQKISFGVFKQELHSYLMASLPVSHKTQRFSQQLRLRLDHFASEHDHRQLNPFLLRVTCRNLLKFLTVESAQDLNHHVLVDLVSNLNPFLVAELLLRILLVCPHSRIHLDRRMLLLFNHYADSTQAEVRWFVQLLEYLNLAYCTNFGSLVLPHRVRSQHPEIAA